MYAFLTLAFILVVCICLSKLFRKNKRYYGIKTFFEIMGAFMIAAVVIFVVIVALSFISAHQLEKSLPVQKVYLIEQAKTSENLLRDERLLSDILEYNETLRTLIKRHQSPWTNFLVPIDLSENKTIDLYDILQERGELK